MVSVQGRVSEERFLGHVWKLQEWIFKYTLRMEQAEGQQTYGWGWQEEDDADRRDTLPA